MLSLYLFYYKEINCPWIYLRILFYFYLFIMKNLVILPFILLWNIWLSLYVLIVY